MFTYIIYGRLVQMGCGQLFRTRKTVIYIPQNNVILLPTTEPEVCKPRFLASNQTMLPSKCFFAYMVHDRPCKWKNTLKVAWFDHSLGYSFIQIFNMKVGFVHIIIIKTKRAPEKDV